MRTQGTYIGCRRWLELLDGSVGCLLAEVLNLGLAEHNEGLWALAGVAAAVVGPEDIGVLDHEQNLQRVQ
jgi:hypothetical protein